ncbi:MAG: NusG domain II-containing protein [Christensenellales bacterium]|jgi:hypothetical protein
MKKADWRLIVGLGAAALIALATVGFLSRGAGGRARVLVSGQEVAVLPLDRDARYALPHNTVVVSGGEVYMESADCPDQLCVRQGRRHRAGEQIICLPNQVAVIIEGATDGGVDAVAQ